MSNALALNNAHGDLYGQQVAGTVRNPNDLTYDGNLVDWSPLLFPEQRTYYWWPAPVVYPTTTVVITNGHRVCSCPKCAGDCCDCADCKVKRLEKRVADLERER